ncbi:MAG TPA: T9SS type A sorting domain-containing protein, partial [Methanosarcina sp.]|nr:T9SS type A sorting domain-containing protein [Methanosarcina sp.]
VLHSTDYGQTFSTQYITPSFTYGWDEFSFVAGREPGSFYILKMAPCSTIPMHNCIEIHYSSDYGISYNIYHHELDSTFTGIKFQSKISDLIDCYPNPASNILTISINKYRPQDISIQLLDIYGHMWGNIRVSPNQNEATIDVSTLSPGIYFLKISKGGIVIETKKVVITRY